MRHFLAAIVCLFGVLLAQSHAFAFEVISVPDNVNAINLRAGVDIIPGENGRIQLSTAAGEDGIIRRIEVLATEDHTNPNWALFALRNDSDVQIERLLVAPFFRLSGSGVINPDLGAPRLTALTVSHGLRPDRLRDAEADVFKITLDPGATVTFVAEMSGQRLPELYVWKPDAYVDYINSFTLFRGTVLGISSLAAVFLTIMFVVKGRGVFPATAAFAWAVLTYLLVDFGIMGPLVGISNGAVQPMRAAAEAGLATTLFGFLFVYLNLHRWHIRFLHLALGLVAVFLFLFGLAFFQPPVAASIARFVLLLLGITGLFLVLLLALRGYDRAVFLVPTWIIYLAWLAYGWMVVTGAVSNDIAQPAVAGGLVLLVMLIGFTTVQHAFSEGQVSVGTLSEVERRALALTGSGDFVFDWNIERDRVNVSESLGQRLGERRGGLRGSVKRWLDRIHPEDRDRFRTALDTLVELRRGKVNSTIRIVCHDGSYRAFRLRVKPVLGSDGQTSRIVGTLQDVSDQRAAQERLLHDSVTDSLTGMPNRELFLDRLNRAMLRSRTNGGGKPAVFLIDIDQFSQLNERMGIAGTDSILLATARRISRLLNPLDTVSRINGDQFAVILSSEHAATKIAEIAEQIRKSLRAPYNFGERDLTLTVSVGVTIYDNSEIEAIDVLRDAELAMYYAKRQGGDRIESYRASSRSITAYSKATEEDLVRGIREGEFRMVFQPIVDLTTNSIAGAEALMRWHHSIRGVISPNEFIPLAERTGQIGKLGRIAFEQAAQQARGWANSFALDEHFFVSVNLSPHQLASENMLQDLRLLVAENAGIIKHMKLEVTESQVMANPEHAAYVLGNLKALGLRLALDDFGTGYSSLSYLHRFPFDTIKIPAPFVRIAENADMAHTQVPVMRAVLSLAEELSLTVVAEGVETDEEVQRLRKLNCRFVQGNLFGSAMSSDEMHRRLAVQFA